MREERLIKEQKYTFDTFQLTDIESAYFAYQTFSGVNSKNNLKRKFMKGILQYSNVLIACVKK